MTKNKVAVWRKLHININSVDKKNMIRSFLPVGQGAFYCECFGDNDSDSRVNVIYDCGSSTDITIVETQIRNMFKKKVKINALFISHLDEDHMNGIPYLLKYCEVDRIYFPEVTESNKIILKINLEIKNIDGFTRAFLYNPILAIAELGLDYRPRMIRIGEYQEEVYPERTENRNDNIQLTSGVNLFNDIVDTMMLEDIPMHCQWYYVPFNFRNQKRIQDLLNALQNEFNRPVAPTELETLWRGGENAQKKIKDAYRKIPGSMNTNSMTLFSGTTDDILQQQLVYPMVYKYGKQKYRRPLCCNFCHKPAGCLFMGDYDASGRQKWSQLVDAYERYWEFIGCVQVPHHGSMHNFNDEISDMDCYFVISAGTANKYRHPHAIVLKNFIFKQKAPYIVTERQDSAVYISIS